MTGISGQVPGFPGSDDISNWYAIREFADLQPAGGGGGTSFEQQPEIPESNYKFKIEINGRNNKTA
ncbi:hypothetical protein [Hufsiella ginkgonis]|uniref:Uncharacterized protein n=1 Tax=Hufsiella ginkgonis TaxID=2695274 RepID=A0A7K1XXE4_9SPHI|nr:hypothetical protein [Hufsiella ginkgonis]MXV15685.1 hypothetical protein [Hufsiella ginkgonis]